MEVFLAGSVPNVKIDLFMGIQLTLRPPMITSDCLSRIGQKSIINPSVHNGRLASPGIAEDNDFEASDSVFPHSFQNLYSKKVIHYTIF
jgi:hypothetical protein